MKQLDWFNSSLRLKILWLALKGEGIWNVIIRSKYLHKHSLVEWIRIDSHLVAHTSFIWNGFTRLVGWVHKALSCKIGNGEAVLVVSTLLWGWRSPTCFLTNFWITYMIMVYSL